MGRIQIADPRLFLHGAQPSSLDLGLVRRAPVVRGGHAPGLSAAIRITPRRGRQPIMVLSKGGFGTFLGGCAVPPTFGRDVGPVVPR
jgi:hypothetical protein